jgi:hypothetical protein
VDIVSRFSSEWNLSTKRRREIYRKKFDDEPTGQLRLVRSDMDQHEAFSFPRSFNVVCSVELHGSMLELGGDEYLDETCARRNGLYVASSSLSFDHL